MKTTLHSNNVTLTALGAAAKGGLAFLRSRACLLAALASVLAAAPSHGAVVIKKYLTIVPTISVASYGDPKDVAIAYKLEFTGGTGPFWVYAPATDPTIFKSTTLSYDFPSSGGARNYFYQQAQKNASTGKTLAAWGYACSRNTPDLKNVRAYIYDAGTKLWYATGQFSCQIASKWGGFYGPWPTVNVQNSNYQSVKVSGMTIGGVNSAAYASYTVTAGNKTTSGQFYGTTISGNKIKGYFSNPNFHVPAYRLGWVEGELINENSWQVRLRSSSDSKAEVITLNGSR